MYLNDFQNFVKEESPFQQRINKTDHEDSVIQKLKIPNVLPHRSNQQIMNTNIPLNVFDH